MLLMLHADAELRIVMTVLLVPSIDLDDDAVPLLMDTTDVQLTSNGKTLYIGTTATDGGVADTQTLTSDLAAIGNDIPNDTDAIDSLALFYYDDGTAVKKTTGQAAVVPTIDAATGEALFQGLDLIIENGVDALIEVRADLKEMDENDANATARSGMAFAVALDLDETNSEVRGVDSGDTFVDTDITIDNETTERTTAAKTMFVMNNKVIAELASGQTTSTLTNKAGLELIKFTANASGDNSDAPFLNKVVANVALTGSVTITDAALYNDSNEIVALGTTTSASSYTVAVGVDDVDSDSTPAIATSGATLDYSTPVTITPSGGIDADDVITVTLGGVDYDVTGNTDVATTIDDLKVAIDGASLAGVTTTDNITNLVITLAPVGNYTFLVGDVDGSGVVETDETANDEIDGGSETYIIKATSANVDADDAISIAIDINSSGLGSDGITWQDGGTDGTDGVRGQTGSTSVKLIHLPHRSNGLSITANPFIFEKSSPLLKKWALTKRPLLASAGRGFFYWGGFFLKSFLSSLRRACLSLPYVRLIKGRCFFLKCYSSK
jgi:hypothetical protein